MTLKTGTKVLVQYEATVTEANDDLIKVQTNGHWDTFWPDRVGKMLTVIEEPPTQNTLELLDSLRPLQKISVTTEGGVQLFDGPILFGEVIPGKSLVHGESSRRIRFLRHDSTTPSEAYIYGTDRITEV